MKNKPNPYGVIVYDKAKSNKYRNEPTVVDGIRFPSKREADRYTELRLLEKAGIISDLKRQVAFELIPKHGKEQAVKYVADFTYFDNERGNMVIEDVKGFKTPVYKLKRRMMIEKGFIITEVL